MCTPLGTLGSFFFFFAFTVLPRTTLHPTDSHGWSVAVQMISNRWVLDGQLLVSDSELYFMPYSDPWHPFRISLCDVQRILPQETAGTRKRLEVFRHTGGSMLLQFASEQKAMAVAEGIFSKRGLCLVVPSHFLSFVLCVCECVPPKGKLTW